MASSPLGFGLPPPGTVTRKPAASPGAVARTNGKAAAGKPEAAEEPQQDRKQLEGDDDDTKVQEVSPLEHRFVGLVIGKAGETIKSFKKQSGASIEIDQNLPDGLPRAVIYRGTRRQVDTARRLLESLVQRAKDDERAKSGPVQVGMGILGRGPSGEADRSAAAVDGREPPPWRRTRTDDDPRGRADGIWKREREPEAAKAGSLTGGDLSLGMRPAWMKERKAEVDTPHGSSDFTSSEEQRYSRALLIMARQKILRSKAYEVPGEMMTMTTGPRPRHKTEKKEAREASDALAPADPAVPGTRRGIEANGAADAVPSPRPEDSGGEEAGAVHKEDPVVPSSPKKKPGVAVLSCYENLPGDSKDMLKLKKKLREIQKIEEAISAGDIVEPNQLEKVSRKIAYEDELKQLEAIVHPNGRPAEP